MPVGWFQMDMCQLASTKWFVSFFVFKICIVCGFEEGSIENLRILSCFVSLKSVLFNTFRVFLFFVFFRMPAVNSVSEFFGDNGVWHTWWVIRHKRRGDSTGLFLSFYLTKDQWTTNDEKITHYRFRHFVSPLCKKTQNVVFHKVSSFTRRKHKVLKALVCNSLIDCRSLVNIFCKFFSVESTSPAVIRFFLLWK